MISEAFSPGSGRPDVDDADLLLRHDGSIVNVEGWFHPPGHILGEVLYIPDSQGSRSLFKKRYTKISVDGQNRPVPYELRRDLLISRGVALPPVSGLPIAKYKELFPAAGFQRRFGSRSPVEALLSAAPDDARLRETIGRFFDCLSGTLAAGEVGITGSARLGVRTNLHDVDVVIYASPSRNREAATQIDRILTSHPGQRVHDGGKGWRVRMWLDPSTLICCFFGYSDRRLAPIAEGDITLVRRDLTVVGAVLDDVHSFYTPSVLDVQARAITDGEGRRVRLEEAIRLVIYHTAARGDLREGDRFWARGDLVRVSDATASWLALCVVGREDVRSLTPPWGGYYD